MSQLLYEGKIRSLAQNFRQRRNETWPKTGIPRISLTDQIFHAPLMNLARCRIPPLLNRAVAKSHEICRWRISLLLNFAVVESYSWQISLLMNLALDESRLCQILPLPNLVFAESCRCRILPLPNLAVAKSRRCRTESRRWRISPLRNLFVKGYEEN